MVESKKLSAYRWWSYSQNNTITANSPWLQSTLIELDEKTESMLNLIEQEADSFAKRAEMYYKKRPELVTMIEDLYRSHRSLAQRYDQTTKFDFDSSHRVLNVVTDVEKSYESYSDSVEFNHDQDFSTELEIDDEESSSGFNGEEVMNLREEVERLKEENKIQKGMLDQKDGEKREVIRQLCLCVDSIRQENLNVRRDA